MKEYICEWGECCLEVCNEASSAPLTGKNPEELIPEGLCPLAFITCFPYIWTFQHGGWFRWVARRKRLIKWRNNNLNMATVGEVIAVCPNPYGRVLFSVARDGDSSRITVKSIKGVCAKKHFCGQTFHIKYSKEDAKIFYQVFPYYCLMANRNFSQDKQNSSCYLSSCDGKKLKIYDKSRKAQGADSKVCRNNETLRQSSSFLNITNLRMPCGYQKNKRSYDISKLNPMGKMCYDAAWAVYPSALAALYGAHPKEGNFFQVYCPSGEGRVVWEVLTFNRFNFIYAALRNLVLRLLSLAGICIDRPDKVIKLRVKDVEGECQLGYRGGEEFLLNISDQDKLCPAAFQHFYPLALQWLGGAQVKWKEGQEGQVFSCPDVHGSDYCLTRPKAQG